MKEEINRIAIGSCDIYFTEFLGTKISDIPSDTEIEKPENLIGRTKDGGEIKYTANYYTAKSDDGKASRSGLQDEAAEISFGIITWNGNTITKLVSTASATVTSDDGKHKRRTLIGGIENDNGKTYLVRAVHKDKIKGDVRYTIIGKNVQGFAASYKNGQETTITPNIAAEPFENGRLIILDEDDVDAPES